MLVLLAFLSFPVYRATRLIVEDGVFRAQREWLLKKILVHWECDFEGDIQPQPLVEANGGISKWRLKLHELLTCPYCMSLWVAAPIVAFLDLIGSVPLPLLMWLGVGAGAMVIWTFAED